MNNSVVEKQKFTLIQRVIRVIALGLVSIALSLVVIVGAAIVFACVSDYIYNSSHQIPDPVARGEDLGLGLVVVASAVGSLLVSIPCSVFIHLYLFRRFGERVGNN